MKSVLPGAKGSVIDLLRKLAGLWERVGWSVTEYQVEHPYPVAEKGEDWLELQPVCLYGVTAKAVVSYRCFLHCCRK